MTLSDLQRKMTLLQSMSQAQNQFATWTSVSQLMMIGLMRVLKKDADATLELKRTLAEFAGTGDDAHSRAAVKETRAMLEGAYE